MGTTKYLVICAVQVSVPEERTKFNNRYVDVPKTLKGQQIIAYIDNQISKKVDGLGTILNIINIDTL